MGIKKNLLGICSLFSNNWSFKLVPELHLAVSFYKLEGEKNMEAKLCRQNLHNRRIMEESSNTVLQAYCEKFYVAAQESNRHQEGHFQIRRVSLT